MFPADENDEPIYEGRFNLGAISLHFPMIVAKAQQEGKDFYEVLTYYLDMCRDIHKRTFSYLSHKKAGTNPLGFCQGGFLNGNFDPEDEIGEDFLEFFVGFGELVFADGEQLQRPCGECRQFVDCALIALHFLNDLFEFADCFLICDFCFHNSIILWVDLVYS